ncbi:hypothetical protein IV203_003893 [Nitzschia inconspicua]|uniref:Uncharacterized protein n=1 Tax=Nitzschia inconspicua TaxID=303405 RepID=A0A9K3PP64_9STRA|nr:hypothetical protein IV203_003893 [Nitzschia inconspicua]
MIGTIGFPVSEHSTTQTAAIPVMHLQTEPHRKWAYAFLVGGVHSTRPGSNYMGSLYSVVAIVHKLRNMQSVADFVVMIQISASSTNSSTLTPLEEEVFDKLNVTVVYLPRPLLPELETFYSLVVQGKFYILNLVQYSRVMFMDIDIFPRCNLDYIFALSEPDSSPERQAQTDPNFTRNPYLKENVVMGWKHEPSNAALFVLKPQLGAYDKVLQPIIDRKESRPWDPVLGWGHKIDSDDPWVAPSGMTGTNWTWAYAFADQGLLYHWTKYVQRSVSLITPGVVENWGTSSCPTSKVVCKETTLREILEPYSCRRRVKREMSPYRDIFHFTGDRKPWWSNQTKLEEDLQRYHLPLSATNNTRSSNVQVPHGLNFRQEWYWHLNVALSEIGLCDQVLSLNVMGREESPPVGRSSSMEQMKKYIEAKKTLFAQT